ncbi:hypothetical protein HDU91_003095 [Kappamyces sp. JEL0680]|nr:hypothetical protein HDU91_003095 [Kappamyces sp. JEL0680]
MSNSVFSSCSILFSKCFDGSGEADARWSSASTLLDHNQPVPFSTTLTVEDIALALSWKERGNEMMERGEYRQAREAYSTGLELYGEKSQKTAEDSSLLEQEAQTAQPDGTSPLSLLCMLLSNRACCNLYLYAWEEALRDANYTGSRVGLWPLTLGHLRRGDALFGLRLYSFALESFESALQCSDTRDPHVMLRVAKCNLFLEHEEQGMEIHQLLPGRDICLEKDMSMIFAPINTTIWHRVAIPLRNFIYFIVNKDTREAVVVDACWDVDGILRYAAKMDISIVAAFVSHYHTDHIGGIPQAPFDRYPIRVEVGAWMSDG